MQAILKPWPSRHVKAGLWQEDCHSGRKMQGRSLASPRHTGHASTLSRSEKGRLECHAGLMYWKQMLMTLLSSMQHCFKHGKCALQMRLICTDSLRGRRSRLEPVKRGGQRTCGEV